jgi:hypothetical protein
MSCSQLGYDAKKLGAQFSAHHTWNHRYISGIAIRQLAFRRMSLHVAAWINSL